MGGTIVDIRWRGRELQHTPEINKTAAHPSVAVTLKPRRLLSNFIASVAGFLTVLLYVSGEHVRMGICLLS